MSTPNKFEGIFDPAKIESYPDMNLPRIVTWLEGVVTSPDDPFSNPTIADMLRNYGVQSIRKIRRLNESMRDEPPFYGAQIILNSGVKIRFSYEIDLWIAYDELVASFLTTDSTSDTSRLHEELMLAKYQYDNNSKVFEDQEREMNRLLNTLPFEMRANLRIKHQEKIADANLFQNQLKIALDQCHRRYIQSMELDNESRYE